MPIPLCSNNCYWFQLGSPRSWRCYMCSLLPHRHSVCMAHSDCPDLVRSICVAYSPIGTLFVLAEAENVAPHHHCDDEVQHSRYACEHNMICAEAFYYIFRACCVRLVALSISPMLLVLGGPGCPFPYASITVTGSNWGAQIL